MYHRHRTAAGTTTSIGVVVALVCAAPVAAASPPAGPQEPESERLEDRVAALEEQVAGLEAELRELRGRVERRLRALEEAAGLGPASQAEPAPEAAVDDEERREIEEELAAILGEDQRQEEAAAGEAAGPPETRDTTQAPSGGQRRFTGRTRNLQELNPEISVTGDVFGVVADRSGDPEANQFRFAEFEAAFQAPLDPFSTAKFFVVHEEGEFELEEGYIDWTSLPGGIGLKVGQMRMDWGKLNRWHQHALPQADRPLVHQLFWGEGGLKGLGTSFSWLPSPFLGDYNEVWVQVVNDQNDTAFSGRGFDEPVFLVHETNYWDLTPASYLEVGLSAATGVNDPRGRRRTQVYGVDWNFDWTPPARSLYEGFELRGELMWQRREEEGVVLDSLGVYTYGTYRLDRRWLVGLRGDWTELPAEPGASVWGLSPYVEWWQSEWARIRFQYSHNSRTFEDPESENKFFVQVTWALGPHKHERY